MVVVLWALIIAACFFALFFNAYITFNIVEWEVEHSSPLDLCSSLNRFVQKAYVSQGILVVLCLCQFYSSFATAPIVVMCVGLFVFAYPRKNRRNGRYFDPSTMVRQSNRLKISHGCAVGADFVALLYSVFFFVRAILGKG
jgi:hypothetical protein